MTLGALMDFERKCWSKKWSLLNKWIFAALAILWLGISVFLAYKGLFNEPRLAWLALFGLGYLGLGFGARTTLREWKEETLYWWLSLPAPREKLLLAKALIALERWAKIYALVFVYVAGYIYLIDLVNGLFSWQQFWVQMQIGVAEILLAVTLAPFLVMVGMLLGSFTRSSSRFFLGLAWGVVIIVLNLQINLIGLQLSGKVDPTNILAQIHYSTLLIEGIVAYGLALIIFRFVAYRLKNGKMFTGSL